MAINAADWPYHLRVPISYTPSAATSGQMLMLTEKVLEKVPQMTQDLFWLNVKNGGGDIRLCENEDGTGQLPIEVKLCDTVSRKMIIWYRLPVFVGLESLYLFYNNNSASSLPLTHDYGQYAAWQDFSFVSHNGVDDVTGNLTLESAGTITPSIGVFGDASGSIDLDVTTEAYLQCSIPPRNGGEDSFRTWSKRRNSSSEGATAGIFVSSSSGEYRNTFIRAVDSAQMAANSVSAWMRQEHSVFGYAAATEGGVSSHGVWERLVSNFSQAQRQIILNDTHYAENSEAAEDTKDYDRFAIGGLRDRTPGGYFDGLLSEIWWETAIPSEAKISTEYANQSDNANFYGTPTLYQDGKLMRVFSGGVNIQTLSSGDCQKQAIVTGQTTVNTVIESTFYKKLSAIARCIFKTTITGEFTKHAPLSGGVAGKIHTTGIFNKTSVLQGWVNIRARITSRFYNKANNIEPPTITIKGVLRENIEIKGFINNND
ncbi:hypothetical protein ACQKDY_00415 [Alteromonas macleodii]|uniref:hypothetical protein n=1 Tax=Alteromonas macleodii TaxID=28108 RepID=UPI003D06418D